MNIKIQDMPELLEPQEVADFLRVSVYTVKRWETNGSLIPIRIGSRRDRQYRKKDILAIYNGEKEL